MSEPMFFLPIPNTIVLGSDRAIISVSPLEDFHPVYIIVPRSLAQDFMISRVSIGRKGQIIGENEFSAEVLSGEVVVLNDAVIAKASLDLPVAMKLDSCRHDDVFTIVVHNRNFATRNFSAVVAGTSLHPPAADDLPSTAYEYGVAIGMGAKVVEYGEIVFATKDGAELRIKMDGLVSINGVTIGTDLEVYECFRNVFGRPLPAHPKTDKGMKAFAFSSDSQGSVVMGKLSVFSDCIIVGDYHPSLGEDGNIIFKNNNGSVMAITCKGRVFPSHCAVDLGVKLDNIGSEDRHLLINSLRFLMGLEYP